ncbi:MAG: UDP-N-acetylmuramate--L-alanine ligase [Solirubrobacterales bacterium]
MSAPGSTERPWIGRRLHFVGAGGAGMSGLALIARSLGAEVSGCDRSRSVYTEMLSGQGVEVEPDHAVAHAVAGTEMVVSSAIADDLEELKGARELGLELRHRSELLAQAASLRDVIAVSGTHGKTTTAAMIAHCLEMLAMDPGFAIGADLRGADGELRPNAAWGTGQWMVVEADESDRSFLRLDPRIAVVTNVELDHHTTYASEPELEAAFVEFAQHARATGDVVAWERVATRLGGSTTTFGFGESADLRAVDVRRQQGSTSFDLVRSGKSVARVALPVVGAHNVLNALAALGALEAAGCTLSRAAGTLESFRPVGRRFELAGESDGARVFDDYAHHPTEVRATLEAARELGPERLIAVFQPHLYSRTKYLHRAFGSALAVADEIVVLDVYPARELPEGDLAGVTGKLVADAAADAAPGRPVWWLPTLAEAEHMVRLRLRPGTTVVTLGAGDVNELAAQLVGGARP